MQDLEYEYSYLLIKDKTSNPLLKTRRPEYWNPNDIFHCEIIVKSRNNWKW